MSMLVNEAMRRVLDKVGASSVTSDDVPTPLRGVLSEGWVHDDGAWLLRGFLHNYRGDRSHFTDLTGYEAAVNGRSIPDYDLQVQGDVRLEIIFRRSYSFACSALVLLKDIPSPPPVVAYVSIGESLTEESVIEAHVTFCVVRDEEAPYLDDIENMASEAVMAIELDDCPNWMSNAH